MTCNYKIILYGEYGVGKTSLVNRLVYKDFNIYPSTTIGATFVCWKTEENIKVGLWDTAGQERFANLLPLYLRGTDAVFYCWDYNIPFDTKLATIAYNKAKEYSPEAYFYLIMTKTDKDLYPHSKSAEEWASVNSIMKVYYTCSMTGYGVSELFYSVLKDLKRKPKNSIKYNSIKLDNKIDEPKKYCCLY
jgi:small GTP-binding protein